MLVAWLPYLVASAIEVQPTDPFNLTVVALPLSFVIAFFGIRSSRAAAATVLVLALLAQFPTPARAEGEPDGGLVLPGETCRGMFVVPVTFGADRSESAVLLLDTGASRTYLDPRAFRRVTGKRVNAGKTTLRGARVGEHGIRPLRVYALPMRRLSLAIGRQIDGILGFPAFKDVLLTLDYGREQVRISGGSLPEPDGREIFDAPGKRPHLSVRIGDVRRRLRVDSGATGAFELKRSDRVRWSVEPRPVRGAVVVGGFVVLDGGRLQGEVRLGPVLFEDPLVIRGGSERLIGWRVLRHFEVTFDQRNARMRLRAVRPGPIRMGPLVGLGLVYDPVPDGLRVVRIFPGSSADAAGMREGDLIVAIDGRPVHPRGCAEPPEGAGERRDLTIVRAGARTEVRLRTEILVP